MSERKATEMVVAATIENRISKRCSEISEREIEEYEPTICVSKGEIVVGKLNHDLKKWYIGTQMEYARLQSDLYAMSEADQGKVNGLCMEIAGIVKAEFLFVMAVRGFLSNSFPENEGRQFELRKGWEVVCFETDNNKSLKINHPIIKIVEEDEKHDEVKIEITAEETTDKNYFVGRNLFYYGIALGAAIKSAIVALFIVFKNPPLIQEATLSTAILLMIAAYFSRKNAK